MLDELPLGHVLYKTHVTIDAPGPNKAYQKLNII